MERDEKWKRWNQLKLRNKRTGSTETLCSYCGHACNNGCSWSARGEPVNGWDAVKTSAGYFVFDCPEAVNDRWMRENPEDLDTDGCVALLQAMLGQMREDYVLGNSSVRKGIERMILNPKTKNLFFFSDPQTIIRMLKQQAEDHDYGE